MFKSTWKDKATNVACEIRTHTTAARETYLQSDADARDVLRSIWQAWEDASRIFNRACVRAEALAGHGDVQTLYRTNLAALLDIGDVDDPTIGRVQAGWAHRLNRLRLRECLSASHASGACPPPASTFHKP